MTSLAPYAKCAVAVLTAAALTAQSALSDGTITAPEWLTIIIAALGAVGVFTVPNKPDNPPAPDNLHGKHERPA